MAVKCYNLTGGVSLNLGSLYKRHALKFITAIFNAIYTIKLYLAFLKVCIQIYCDPPLKYSVKSALLTPRFKKFSDIK